MIRFTAGCFRDHGIGARLVKEPPVTFTVAGAPLTLFTRLASKENVPDAVLLEASYAVMVYAPEPVERGELEGRRGVR